MYRADNSPYSATTGLDFYQTADVLPAEEAYGGGGAQLEEPVRYPVEPTTVFNPAPVLAPTSIFTMTAEPIRAASTCGSDLCHVFSADTATAVKTQASEVVVLPTTVPTPPPASTPTKSFPWLLLLAGGAGLYFATRKSTSLNGPDDAGLGRAPRRRSTPRAPQRKAPAKKATSRASLTI